eukprot:5234948-Prymnesium_polylepis.2
MRRVGDECPGRRWQRPWAGAGRPQLVRRQLPPTCARVRNRPVRCAQPVDAALAPPALRPSALARRRAGDADGFGQLTDPAEPLDKVARPSRIHRHDACQRARCAARLTRRWHRPAEPRAVLEEDEPLRNQRRIIQRLVRRRPCG